MQQLRYQDELKDFSEVPIGNAEVKEQELKLAVQLVDQIATEAFKPDAYEDEVRKKVRSLIEQKVAGQEITAAPPEAPKAQIIDLMEALKASLAAAGPSSDAARKPAKPSPRKPSEVAGLAKARGGGAASVPAEATDAPARRRTAKR
jgi:DNA end-binding protein Ku